MVDNSFHTLTMTLETGEVKIKLRPDLAPNHVARIGELANEGFYDGVVFHRVIDGFMAQGGDPSGRVTGGSNKPNLKQEFFRRAARARRLLNGAHKRSELRQQPVLICFAHARQEELSLAGFPDQGQETTLSWDRVLGGRKTGVVFLEAERPYADNRTGKRLGAQALNPGDRPGNRMEIGRGQHQHLRVFPGNRQTGIGSESATGLARK